ncbi:MAG: hypothetical protein FJ265_16790 [Planctomycetes bacterium]|nr:hypothetical protein [Planctomycetota bacterium]
MGGARAATAAGRGPTLPAVRLPLLDEAFRARQRYQASFCEENVWWLLQSPELPEPRAAVFVSNRARTVATWGQRAAAGNDPIVWDYHVVVLLPGLGVVVDLDDRERVGWPLREWLAHAFRRGVEPEFRPRFRVVDGEEFLASFSSDRSHMLDARGRPRAPFPPWPAPFDPERGMNLLRFVDLDDPIAGVVVDAAGLLRLAGR